MNIKMLSHILFGSTILFAIISKLIFLLIFIPIVYSFYIKSKEYLYEKNLRYDLFKISTETVYSIFKQLNYSKTRANRNEKKVIYGANSLTS